jgi:8-oxo-dGTP diphosphatase
MLGDTEITYILIPHCASVSRDSWTGDHDVRPLTQLGHQQAQTLAGAITPDIDAIYTSPTARCRQTVEPLSARSGLPLTELPELYEAAGFHEPTEWVAGVYAPMGQAIGSAWTAGRALTAITRLATAHPGGTVVLCSHGDVIPVLLSLLAGMYRTTLPPVADRGGWYTLHFAAGRLVMTSSR